MPSTSLAELMKLPADARADLAIALWESLTDAEREAEFALTPEQQADLNRRWEEHLTDPGSALPWDQVRRKLQHGE